MLLLDLMMPVMLGFDFLEKLRSRKAWSEVPVIVLAAMDLSADERQLLEASTRGVIQKGPGSPRSGSRRYLT
jgi:CheY-like chemotaxis protein